MMSSILLRVSRRSAECLNVSLIGSSIKNKCIEGAVKAVEMAATDKEGGGGE